jgi:type I restriction enzyme S subunit
MSDRQTTLSGISEQDREQLQTRVGPKKVILPEEWEISRLNELASVSGGKRLPKGHSYAGEVTQHPYIRVVDFENGTVSTTNLKYLKQKTRDEIERYTISSENVYISIAGTLGIAGIIPESVNGANLTENAAKIHDLSRIQRNYLSYYLRSKFGQDEVHRFTVGSTQPKLSLFRLRKLEVIHPPLEEQRKIATVLYTVDQAIQNTEDILGRYEQLQTGLLRKYFGKSSDQNSQFEKRESKRLGPTTLNVPKEWEVVQIDDIGEVFTGNTPSTDREEYFGGSLPFITPENFNNSKYVHNGSRTLTTEGSEKVPVLPKDSVMVECIGRVGRIRMTGDELATNQQINSVIADDSQMNPEFLYYHLLALSDIIEAQAGQTTTPILRKSLFESLNIFCPPEDDQEKIVQSMNIFEDAKEKERERLSKLMSMKKGLMQDLLSGAVRTHETDIDIPEAVLAHG